MSMADTVLVMGDGCRPTILAGDREQLPPTVMTHDQTRDGRIVNMLSAQAKVSILEKLQRSGWPSFILTNQYRIVSGSFDLARTIIYPGIKDFQYAESAALTNHPMATQIETWVTSTYQAAPSPPGKILPLFFHCNGAQCLVDEAVGSRYNDRHNGLVVKLVLGLRGLGVKASDIVVITPYWANLGRLEMALKAGHCRVVVVSTTDAFQGQEGLVVIFDLVVNRATGPLFVQDPHRICVGATRHVGALFVVGDINTVSDLVARGEVPVRSDTGQTLSVKKTVFRDFL
ncbi:AAA domain-containing protein [Parachaetomium inaequale]|uniref:AAA domain-containing protein n=1 Tax=Parachaetomium inaequale TaxID=2588326 RepID=A0AAN6P4Y4_9PEZI|nr:AAA domain-containing protein [Parachaetomium inaequale]